MIDRRLKGRLEKSSKSILLLGPRQVGKSTLIHSLKPDRLINLMEEGLHVGYAKEPARLKRELLALRKPSLIAVDEIQRVPALLNTIQASLDEGLPHRFILTGSSARKLRRGQANLLPGRILLEYLDPLSFWELGDQLDLEKALRIGTLPGIYLDEKEGAETLSTYGQVYLREEIHAEALTQNLGGYARFLDVVAEANGDWINYSKIASDSEIPKETVRRFFTLLEDTLIAFRIPAWRPKLSRRHISQRDRFLFFDVGVRNALLGIHLGLLSPLEKGKLFEQWILLQLIYFMHSEKRHWKISAFRTDTGLEADGVLETEKRLLAIECKWGRNVSSHDWRGLRHLETASGKRIEKFVVYGGETVQRFSSREEAVPYAHFLKSVIPSLK